MEKYQDVVLDPSGNVVVSASVYIYAAGTTTPSTIYSDDGVTPASNPLTTGSRGGFEFYAANGDYDIRVVYGTSDVTESDVTIGYSSTSPGTIVVNSSSPALTVTQTGTGDALLIEDSSNPDSTPFRIDGSGKVLIGTSGSGVSVSGISAQFQQIGTTVGLASELSAFFAASTNSSNRIFLKSRSTTVGTLGTIVVNNDPVGVILWVADDGTTTAVPVAEIRAVVDGTPGASDMPGRLVFSTTADGASTLTERMRISSTGLVTTSASVQVHSATAVPAGGTAGAGITMSSTTNLGVFFGSGAPTLSAAKGSLYLRTDGSGTNDRMYVNTNGTTTWTAVVTVA
jgi:hypothetical protein